MIRGRRGAEVVFVAVADAKKPVYSRVSPVASSEQQQKRCFVHKTVASAGHYFYAPRNNIEIIPLEESFSTQKRRDNRVLSPLTTNSQHETVVFRIRRVRLLIPLLTV